MKTDWKVNDVAMWDSKYLGSYPVIITKITKYRLHLSNGAQARRKDNMEPEHGKNWLSVPSPSQLERFSTVIEEIKKAL